MKKLVQKLLPNSIFYRLYTEQSGSVLPIAALTFPVILAMVGLGTDASMWMANKRNLQIAADSAVIAAGWELAQESPHLMDGVAFREAERNGYDSSANGELTLNIVETTSEGTRLSISLIQDADRFFSQIIMSNAPRVSAYAEVFVDGVNGLFCILALEEVTSDSFETHGAVDIDMPDCGIAVNSSSDEALTLSGNVDVNVASVRITGDYDVSGSVDFTYKSLKTGRPPVADPYATLEVPENTGCDSNNVRVNSSTTLTPGRYCGGLDISGNNIIDFEPGVYVIDGGDFKVTGQGEINAEGVTFILTGSGSDYAQLDVSGGKVITMSPPVSGEDWSGVTFFQDRDAPTGSNFENKLVGTSDIIFDGVAYFPSQGLWFGGNNNALGAVAPCTKLIARTVTFAGNPRLGNNCSLYDTEDIGVPAVRLIL